MLFGSKARAIFANRLIASIITLVSGTALSQIIGILALPFLTRIFEPDEFSALAFYASMATVIFTVASLRYDIAIVLPASEKEAKSLLIIAVGSSFCISILIFSAVIFYDLSKGSGVIDFSVNTYTSLLILPAGVFLASQNSILKYWWSRSKNFQLVAKAQIVQVFVGVAVQLVFGSLGFGYHALVIGYVVSSCGGVLVLLYCFFKAGHYANLYDKNYFIPTARKYKNFPKYSTWEALFNSGSIELPIVLLSVLVAGPEAGYMFLVMRILGAPVSLLGGAVGQVYLPHAAERHAQGKLNDFTLQVITNLAKVSIIPLLVAGLVSPYIFPLVFGDQWQRAGELVQWAVPWFFLQLLVSPVSTVLHVVGLQKRALYLQFLGLIMRVGPIIVLSKYEPKYIAEAYALSGMFFYALYLCFVIKASQQNQNKVK